MPLPIIFLDEKPEEDYPGPENLRKMLAVLIPSVVQLYVGNIMEPAVFGKSLNVTAISVLVALVLWASLWGLPGALSLFPPAHRESSRNPRRAAGAILSVPLLAASKVLLESADHPLAKMALNVRSLP